MKSNTAFEVQATQLLKDYKPGSSFFFASPTRTLLAQGMLGALPHGEASDTEGGLAGRVATLLESVRQSHGGHPIVVGAIPFDDSRVAQLLVPAETRWAGPLHSHSTNWHSENRKDVGSANAASRENPTKLGQAPDYGIRSVPEPSEFVQGVEQALKYIASGELSKIVLSRTLQLDTSEQVDIPGYLHNLARHNTKGYTFAVDLPALEAEEAGSDGAVVGEERRTLIGASPELLVSREGLHLTVNPLAGSTPRSDDPVEDKLRAAALLESVKDRYEHAVVVEAVALALRPLCRRLDVPQEPSLIQTETMWHLSTEITGELADLSVSSLAVALALHPTPAVCGSPTEQAKKVIRDIESFDRGFYTGIVGWCDAAGDGEWVITIRCAEAAKHSLRLFAGAGIVAASNPEDELAETAAKFGTMLQALGLKHE
ncbi:isochorismate synthase [Paenibacillus polymyxa]|uniref:isochorismate synthase DhbC n=1 Tax=Paenibacillus polymyxa TaxID=1406 RepID=UPI002792BBFC|nr:isochorismate synthase DhbC [Paenibacillus polymyxa]MDQ0047471.1 isochorismate synthase [Paenibacillus polymyxa]